MWNKGEIERRLAQPRKRIGRIRKKSEPPDDLEVPVVGFDPEKALVKSKALSRGEGTDGKAGTV